MHLQIIWTQNWTTSVASTERTVNVQRTNSERTYSSIKCSCKTFKYTIRTVFKSFTNASSLRHSRLVTAADKTYTCSLQRPSPSGEGRFFLTKVQLHPL